MTHLTRNHNPEYSLSDSPSAAPPPPKNHMILKYSLISRIIFQVWLSTCLTWGRILRHKRSQEPITWSLQLLYIFVMAFSQSSLFLVWIYRELGLPTRAHRPIKISTWLISNFLVNISREKQQREREASCDSSSADSHEQRRPKLTSR